jgi:prolyl 4-hydroxylase
MKIRKERLRTVGGEVFGWLIDDVISKDKCDKLINKYKPGIRPSTTLDPYIDDYRTSSNTFISYGISDDVDEIAQVVSDIIESPIENFEGMQFVHYKPGEYYKHHHDYFEADTDYYDREMSRGGQRTWTAFLYLNDVPKGGETYFPEIDFKVKPKVGRMALWMNMIDDIPIVNSLHEALPPIGCEKWGVNIWVREKKFR